MKSDKVKTTFGEPMKSDLYYCNFLIVLNFTLFSLQFTETVQEAFRNTTAMVVDRY